jgi:hypothetical protein
MGIEIRTLRDQEEEKRIATSFTLTERVCLNADKSAVVNCSSEEAAFSLGGAGAMIPMADAERYGLVKTEAPPATEDKMDAPTQHKGSTNGKTRSVKPRKKKGEK